MSIQPLTQQEQEQYEEYVYRNALIQWQEQEEARLNDLSQIQPIADCLLDLEDIISGLSAVEITNPYVQMRVARILQILEFDGRYFITEAQRLSQPNQEPEMPEHMAAEPSV